VANAGGGSRTNKVADQIQRELAQLIQFEMKDPRLGFITVSGVKVSRDFAHADVYVSVLGQDDDPDAEALTIEALSHGAGYLRSSLAKVLSLRTVPLLKFHFDDTTREGNRLSALIDKAVSEDDRKLSAANEQADLGKNTQ